MAGMPNLSLPLLWLAQMALAAFAFSNTNPGSIIRIILFGLLSALSYCQLKLAQSFTTSGFYNGGMASYFSLILLYYANLLFVKGVERTDIPGQDKRNGGLYTFYQSFSLTTTARGVGTPWQVKNVPAFPAYHSKGSGLKQWRFLLRQSCFVAWYCLILDLMSFIGSQESIEERERRYGDGAEFKYLQATKEQWAMRVVTSLMTWFFMARVIIDAFYRFMSLVFVGTGISSPASWPPFFGNMKDAYTLRNYWG
jgi:hypothetical protein